MPEPEPLPVHVSRPELHAIETVDTYQSAGPFTVAITNHGRAAHVHLKLDDDLAQVASLPDDSNVYVETDETVRVRVDVSPGGGPVTGELRVETGYGAEAAAVAVTVGHQARDVDVDESLGSPDPGATGEADPDESASVEVPSPTMPDGILQVAALAVLAVAIAAATVVYVDSVVVVAGVVVVLAAVLIAAVILLR